MLFFRRNSTHWPGALFEEASVWVPQVSSLYDCIQTWRNFVRGSKVLSSLRFPSRGHEKYTDARTTLYNELQTGVLADVNESKFNRREKKAMYVAKHILKVSFGWSPYKINYYSGDWLLGPNMFCWQPVYNLLRRLKFLYLILNPKVSPTYNCWTVF